MEIEEIVKRINNRSSNVLLIGKESRDILKCAYEKTLSKNIKSVFVEHVKDKYDFWEKISDMVCSYGKIKDKLSGEFAPSAVKSVLTEEINKTGLKYNLFIPDIDKVFYNLDFVQRGQVNNSALRSLMYSVEGNLNIHGSVETENSKEYKSTLKTSNFPFYCGNFCMVD